jgi:hypothetical protein
LDFLSPANLTAAIMPLQLVTGCLQQRTDFLVGCLGEIVVPGADPEERLGYYGTNLFVHHLLRPAFTVSLNNGILRLRWLPVMDRHLSALTYRAREA